MLKLEAGRKLSGAHLALLRAVRDRRTWVYRRGFCEVAEPRDHPRYNPPIRTFDAGVCRPLLLAGLMDEREGGTISERGLQVLAGEPFYLPLTLKKVVK